MLTKFIVNAYQPIIEVMLWITLIAAVIAGFSFAWWGPIVTILIWTIFSSTFIGGFLIINDIRERVKNIEKMNSEKIKPSI